MTATKRVHAAELFRLADSISDLADKTNPGQQHVTEKLAEALVAVIDASKSAAFQEALEQHNAGKLVRAIKETP